MGGEAEETHHGRWPGAVKNFGLGLYNIWAVKMAFDTLYFGLGHLVCIKHLDQGSWPLAWLL